MRTELFWAITQSVVVIPYRRFGTTCLSPLQGSRIHAWPLKRAQIVCPETSVNNYDYILLNSTEERSSQVLGWKQPVLRVLTSRYSYSVIKYLPSKWSEVSGLKWVTVTFLGTKAPSTLGLTLYWGYLTVLWLFHLVCILYCCCFNLFCNVWVGVCGGVLVICILAFAVFCIVYTVFLYCFVYVYLFLFVLSVLV